MADVRAAAAPFGALVGIGALEAVEEALGAVAQAFEEVRAAIIGAVAVMAVVSIGGQTPLVVSSLWVAQGIMVECGCLADRG